MSVFSFMGEKMSTIGLTTKYKALNLLLPPTFVEVVSCQRVMVVM